jgi:hypothetical protein
MKWVLSIAMILGFFTFVGVAASRGNTVAIVFSVFLGILILLIVSHFSHVYAMRTLVSGLKEMLATNKAENTSEINRWRAETERYRAMGAAQRLGLPGVGQYPMLPGAGQEQIQTPGARFYDSETMFERLDEEDRRHRRGDNGYSGRSLPGTFSTNDDPGGEEEMDL